MYQYIANNPAASGLYQSVFIFYLENHMYDFMKPLAFSSNIL